MLTGHHGTLPLLGAVFDEVLVRAAALTEHNFAIFADRVLAPTEALA